jgi:C4-type Zn-finger protein
MKNIRAKEQLVKQIAEISYESCKICGKSQRIAMYRFRHQQYTPYTPQVLEPVCRKCVYKEIYGSKNWFKNLKKGSLDEK